MSITFSIATDCYRCHEKSKEMYRVADKLYCINCFRYILMKIHQLQEKERLPFEKD